MMKKQEIASSRGDGRGSGQGGGNISDAAGEVLMIKTDEVSQLVCARSTAIDPSVGSRSCCCNKIDIVVHFTLNRRFDDCPYSGDHRSYGRCRPPLVDALSSGALR
jgi:hypothetical protein